MGPANVLAIQGGTPTEGGKKPVLYPMIPVRSVGMGGGLKDEGRGERPEVADSQTNHVSHSATQVSRGSSPVLLTLVFLTPLYF